MATERLTVLAGAAALGEFTAPELAAYTGANANTVRQVLQREQKRHGFFEKVEAPKGGSSTGRPAVLWRLNEEHRARILDEVAREKARITQLRVSSDDNPAESASENDPIYGTEAFVSSAEEAVARSYEASDPGEKQTLARIAINFLHAADPYDLEAAEEKSLGSDSWWQRDHSSTPSDLTASLETISRVSLESHLRTVVRLPAGPGQEELLRRRAHLVAAFAALSRSQAEGSSIDPRDLMDASEAISEGSRVLPVPQTLTWIKRFVDTSIASGNPAPVAVLTKAQETPDRFFPVSPSQWSKVSPPAELARSGYSMWVERWAEALLAYSLIPGIVVAHDDSPESDETLTQIIKNTEEIWLGRAVVVVSTNLDPQVVARVSSSGGVFYPFPAPLDGLLTAVNRAVVRAVSVIPDLGAFHAMASASYQHDSAMQFQYGPILDMMAALNDITARPSELELAQRTLEVFDEAVMKFNKIQPEEGRSSELDRTVTYAAIVRRVADQLADLGNSRHVLAVAEDVLSNCRRMLEYKPLLASRSGRAKLERQRLHEIAQRREIADDMAWAYDLSSDSSEGTE